MNNLKLLKTTVKFPICTAKANGVFHNRERNVIYNSKLQVKDYSQIKKIKTENFTNFDEQDFLSLFYKKLIMILDNMKLKIREFLGYKASFYKVDDQSIQKAYMLIQERKNFIHVENALYNLC